MSSPDRITEQDLHALVDSELDTESHSEIEAWLPDHPDDEIKVKG